MPKSVVEKGFFLLVEDVAGTALAVEAAAVVVVSLLYGVVEEEEEVNNVVGLLRWKSLLVARHVPMERHESLGTALSSIPL